MRFIDPIITPIIRCERCRHWSKTKCLIGKQGFPMIGKRCPDYEREPGVEG